jgi:hypothetical protein
MLSLRLGLVMNTKSRSQNDRRIVPERILFTVNFDNNSSFTVIYIGRFRLNAGICNARGTPNCLSLNIANDHTLTNIQTMRKLHTAFLDNGVDVV